MARRLRLDPVSWKTFLAYGALLGAGAVLLDWIEYQRLARAHIGDFYLALVAAAFLFLGIWAGARLVGRTSRPAVPGNSAAQAALGITDRELAVLQALAEGRSNKELARALSISPNTVKTHAARLYEKLGARRRTEAIARARAIGILG